MSTAALLKAAKHIIAEHAKSKAANALTRKKNPAKRKGTARPKRASQVTGKPPTKRLVKRRKENKVEGYFPNPSEVVKAHSISDMPILIQTKATSSKNWITIARARNATYGKKIGLCLSKGSDMMWRVIPE